MIAGLVMLVVAYSVSHRLFEFAWKGQLRTLFPSALAYQARRTPPYPTGLARVLFARLSASLLGRIKSLKGRLHALACLRQPAARVRRLQRREGRMTSLPLFVVTF